MALTDVMKSISMSAQSTVEVDGEKKTVLYMSGDKSPNREPSVNFSIKDADLYADKNIRKQAQKDFAEFSDMVFDS